MRVLTVLLFALALGLPATASAQYNLYGPYQPYNEVLYNEGPGIKFFHDGLVLHPGLATELGYDSNVLYANQAVGAGLLRLRAHLDLATLPPQRQDASYHPAVEFRLGGAFEYRQYLSNDPQINYLSQFSGFINADLAIHPRDPLSLRIYNNFITTPDARNLANLPGRIQPQQYYERIGLLGTLRPFDGPLELGLGEAFHVDIFQDPNLPSSLGNDANVYAQLRVLPQTTIKLEVRSSYVDYYGSAATLPQAVPIRVTFGVNSLILPSLGVTAYAGYGNSLQFGDRVQQNFANVDTRYNNFIAGAEVRLRLLSRMRLAAGWARDFFDSIFATFFKDDRFYLSYDHNIWRGLYAHVQFDAYLRHYGPLAPASIFGYADYTQTDRSDVLLNLNAELNYRVLSWMDLGVSYSLLDDITDFGFCTASPCSAGSSVNAAFIRHAILGKIDIAY